MSQVISDTGPLSATMAHAAPAASVEIFVGGMRAHVRI